MAAPCRHALKVRRPSWSASRIFGALRGPSAIALIGLSFLVSAPAWGETVDDGTRNAARALAEQGKEQFDAGSYERARDLFQRAYTLVPAPTIALFEGRCLVRLGRLVEAEEAFMRSARATLAADSSEQFRSAVRDAESEMQALHPKIPQVTLIVNGPAAHAADLSVKLDGKSVNSALIGVEGPINPGTHVLAAAVPGGEETQVTFSIGEAEHKRVEIQVNAARPALTEVKPPATAKPEPPASSAAAANEHESSWQMTAALAAGGVGVAGIATGAIVGVLAGAQYSKAEQGCTQHVCTEGSAGADALASFRSLRTVSTIGYAVGGIGLAAGVTLFIAAPRRRSTSSASVGVWVTGQSAGVTGTF